MPRVDVRCHMCFGTWVFFTPFRNSARWIVAVCYKCGRKGGPGIDEDDALEQWDRFNDPKAFVKKLA